MHDPQQPPAPPNGATGAEPSLPMAIVELRIDPNGKLGVQSNVPEPVMHEILLRALKALYMHQIQVAASAQRRIIPGTGVVLPPAPGSGG